MSDDDDWTPSHAGCHGRAGLIYLGYLTHRLLREFRNEALDDCRMSSFCTEIDTFR